MATLPNLAMYGGHMDADTVIERYAEVLLEAVENSDISRAEMARRTGIRATTLTWKLQKPDTFKVPEMAAIERALGVKMADLLKAAVAS